MKQLDDGGVTKRKAASILQQYFSEQYRPVCLGDCFTAKGLEAEMDLRVKIEQIIPSKVLLQS